MIQEIQWGYHDEWYYPDGARPVKLFASKEVAETERLHREREARRYWEKNLEVEFGEMHHITSLDTNTLSERLAQLGFPGYTPLYDTPQYDEMPSDPEEEPAEEEEYDEEAYDDHNDEWEKKHDDAERWWHTLWKSIRTPEQRDAVWALFDKVHFYEVVELEAEI